MPIEHRTISHKVLRGNERGHVTLAEFTEWIIPFMTYGSAGKILECDAASAEAVRMIPDGKNGFFNREPGKFLTPYGELKIEISDRMHGGNMRARDEQIGLFEFYTTALAFNVTRIEN